MARPPRVGRLKLNGLSGAATSRDGVSLRRYKTFTKGTP
jgi:hypothetical protein